MESGTNHRASHRASHGAGQKALKKPAPKPAGQIRRFWKRKGAGFFAGACFSLAAPCPAAAYSPELIEAAIMANLVKIRELVSDPAVQSLINEKDDYGNAPLHYAAGRTEDPVQLAKKEAGAKENGFRSIKEFSSSGISAQIIQALVRAGAQVNGQALSAGKSAPLHIAAESCDKRVIETLLAAGADANKSNGYGDFPLHIAVSQCEGAEIVRLLIDRGASASGGPEGKGLPPLLLAVKNGRTDIARLLIDAGAKAAGSLHSREWKDLAAQKGSQSGEAITLILIKSGASIEGGEDSPFFKIIENGWTEAALTALDKDPFLIHALDRQKKAPLHYAAMKFPAEAPAAACRPKIAKALLALKADPNVKDEGGKTPFHYAAMNNCVETAGALRAAGAFDHIEDGEGMTPYSWAVKNSHKEIEGIFISELHQAAFRGDTHHIVRLIRLGLDAGAPGAGGRTPLHWAALGGHEDAVRQLLTVEGLDIGAKDSRGLTPYCLAVLNGHKETAGILSKKAGLADKAVGAIKSVFSGECKEES